MNLQKLKIKGFRGFATEQELNFATPNGTPGSGLTILVGPNSGGKSTLTEALLALAQNRHPSFTVGRRNFDAGDSVEFELLFDDGCRKIIKSKVAGGSEIDQITEGENYSEPKMFCLPSRRVFNPQFGKGEHTRDRHIVGRILPPTRESTLDSFTNRLFNIQRTRETYDSFNSVLKKVINPPPSWTIDQHDNGQYFIKIPKGGGYHTSEGLGDGIVSLFYIIDALYDSEPGEIIVIDEPELSLHPALLRKLSSLFSEYAQDRQIIIATHSPYFTDFMAISNGASLSRVINKNDASTIFELSNESRDSITRIIRNLNNPHILGLDAREVFFLEDNVILVEGQEDVVIYSKILEQLEISLRGSFFGWGVGGAGNMEAICQILIDLGFEKVSGILDGDQQVNRDNLEENFPDYQFVCISTDDIRDKEAYEKRAIAGLAESNGTLKAENEDEVRTLADEINAYFDR